MSGLEHMTEMGGEQGRAYAYLLGELDEAACFRFERDYLADADVYAAYLAAQDELIESYLEGELSPARRERFDRHFLVTEERRERMQLVRDLNASARTSSAALDPRPVRELLPAPNPGINALLASLLRALFGQPKRRLAFAGMVAALALGCFVVWQLMPERRAAPEELAGVAAPSDQTGRPNAPAPAPAATAEIPPDTEEHQPKPAPTPTAETRRHGRQRASYALILSPVSLRDVDGDETHTLRLRRGAGTVRLRLLLEATGELSVVRAQVNTAEGVRVYASGDLNIRRRKTSFVTLKLPTTLLADADYTIRLTSPAEDGAPVITRYTFRVTRR